MFEQPCKQQWYIIIWGTRKRSHIFLSLSVQLYLWFLKLAKVDWEADASTYGSPAPSFQFGFEKQASFLLLKVGLNFAF